MPDVEVDKYQIYCLTSIMLQLYYFLYADLKGELSLCPQRVLIFYLILQKYGNKKFKE